MTDTSSAPLAGVPSSTALLRSTAIAAAVAALLLVTVVMPAEYGVDPTGVGNVLGLTEMGQIKQQLAREAAAEAVVAATPAAAPVAPASGPAAGRGDAPAPAVGAAAATPNGVERTDQMQLTLAPNQGREIKLAMRQGVQVAFRWTTDRGVVNYDTHADRTAPPAIKYHGYEKGQGVAADSGVLVAAFDGMHGWFWRNRTRAPLTVTLTTKGNYQDIKEVK